MEEDWSPLLAEVVSLHVMVPASRDPRRPFVGRRAIEFGAGDMWEREAFVCFPRFS